VATSYVVTASLSANGPTIATLAVAGTAITVPNVPRGTYFVRVTAVNPAGPSAPSNQVVVPVP